MDLASFRKSLGLSQQQCARQLGLNSKGYFSRIERGRQKMPIELALRIETWSKGQLRARDLVPAKKRDLLPEALSAGA